MISLYHSLINSTVINMLCWNPKIYTEGQVHLHAEFLGLIAGEGAIPSPSVNATLLLDGVNSFELKVLLMSVEVLVIENLGQKMYCIFPQVLSFPSFFYAADEEFNSSCTILNSYGRDIFVKLGYDLQSKGVLATKRGP